MQGRMFTAIKDMVSDLRLLTGYVREIPIYIIKVLKDANIAELKIKSSNHEEINHCHIY